MDEFDCSLFSFSSEGFYFFIPRRCVWDELKDFFQNNREEFKFVPDDDWKLKVHDEIIYRKM